MTIPTFVCYCFKIGSSLGVISFAFKVPLFWIAESFIDFDGLLFGELTTVLALMMFGSSFVLVSL